MNASLTAHARGWYWGMLIAAALAAVTGPGSAFAQNCPLGSPPGCTNGVTGYSSGNSTVFSNGTSATQNGASTTYSNGGGAYTNGGTTVYSNGTTSRSVGNTIIYSDGRTCTRTGNSIVCN